MLARRFTIVCLFVAIFGMSLSMLVAKSGRPESMRTYSISCGEFGQLRCAPSIGR